jgi:hypothetical protein
MLCVTDPEYTYTIQDQNKKIAFALLEKAKEICAGRGVRSRFSVLYWLAWNSIVSQPSKILKP